MLLFDILLQWAQGNCPMRRIGHVTWTICKTRKLSKNLCTCNMCKALKDWLFCKTETHKLSEEFYTFGLHWIQLNVLEDNDRHSEVLNGVNGVNNGNFHLRCLTICKTKALPRVAWPLVSPRSPRCISVQSHISMICHTMLKSGPGKILKYNLFKENITNCKRWNW